MRADMPTGAQFAQLLHAAGESSPGNLPEGTYAIALAVRGERELLEAAMALERHGIPHKLIREPDPPFNGAATAIGVVPCPREKVRRLLARYTLLR